MVSLGTAGECGEEVGALRVGLIEDIRTRRIPVDDYYTLRDVQLLASVSILFDHDGVVAVVTENRGYATPDGAPADNDGSLWHSLARQYLVTRGAWPPRQFLPPMERRQ
jgi:hypothetical protein